jgi:diguanylate cyclase (GGDEF)-like protein
VVEGYPLLVFAARMLPFPLGDVDVNTVPIMITILGLTEARTKELAVYNTISKLSVFPYVSEAPHTIILTDVDGIAVASLAWQVSEPGTSILLHASWVIGLLSLLLSVSAFVVARIFVKQAKASVYAHTLARTDMLTGLLNRTGLTELLDSESLQHHLSSAHVAVLYLDVDKFKELNDDYGHDAGDVALQKASERLEFAVRKTDFVARMGGDEFVAILIDANPTRAAENVRTRLLAEAANNVRLSSGISATVRLSIGAAIASDGVDWNELIIRADQAMYVAKKKRSGFEFYDTKNSTYSDDVEKELT